MTMELKCNFGTGIGTGTLIVPDNFFEVYEKLLDHHIRYVFPELCAMLGVDITKDKEYKKLLKMANSMKGKADDNCK